MADTLYSGRRFRTFHVIDEGVREGLAVEVDTSLRAERGIVSPDGSNFCMPIGVIHDELP